MNIMTQFRVHVEVQDPTTGTVDIFNYAEGSENVWNGQVDRGLNMVEANPNNQLTNRTAALERSDLSEDDRNLIGAQIKALQKFKKNNPNYGSENWKASFPEFEEPEPEVAKRKTFLGIPLPKLFS